MGEFAPRPDTLRTSATPEGERHPETSALRGSAQAAAKPTIEQAMRASKMLSDFYGAGSQFDEHPGEGDLTDVPDDEIEQRLLMLAREITSGETTSHREVAGVILGLGVGFGPFGTRSAEVDEAAYAVATAVYRNQGHFTDSAEVTARIVKRK